MVLFDIRCLIVSLTCFDVGVDADVVFDFEFALSSDVDVGVDVGVCFYVDLCVVFTLS